MKPPQRAVYRIMRIGPYVPVDVHVPGECPDCGGQCAPECGEHPLGCIFGGFSEATSYWMIADGCELDHGESQGSLND